MDEWKHGPYADAKSVVPFLGRRVRVIQEVDEIEAKFGFERKEKVGTIGLYHSAFPCAFNVLSDDGSTYAFEGTLVTSIEVIE